MKKIIFSFGLLSLLLLINKKTIYAGQDNLHMGTLSSALEENDGGLLYNDRIDESVLWYGQNTGIILGDEQFDAYLPLLMGKRVAVFSNHTGIVGDKKEKGHLVDALFSKKVDLRVIFAPEHGFRGNAGAGELVENGVDEATGIPIKSLYNYSTHAPSSSDMEEFDVLLVDIQDVGVRFYTYYISMYYLMKACAEYDKAVIILDRPNPNGHYVDGPILKEGFHSGVGVIPIPVIHGLTLGEMARMIVGEGWLNTHNSPDLTVIPCLRYRHQTRVKLTVPPSPNIKTTKTASVYPSTCLLENSILSVGRGTDYPFEYIGAPVLEGIPGYEFTFIPRDMEGAMNPQYEGMACYGLDLRNKEFYGIIEEGLILDYVIDAYNALKKAKPGVRFWGQASQGKYMIDLLMGTDTVRLMIENGKSAEEIKYSWQEEIKAYKAMREKYLLYR